MSGPYLQVPAGEGRGARLSAEQRFRVIDVEGGQVVDLFAFAAEEPMEYASAQHTRVHVNGLFPKPGQEFVTNQRRPILRLEEDRSPGIHDMLCAACDPRRYESLGVEGWHASCQENLYTVMAGFGHTQVHTPQPINLFMNVRVDADGSLIWGPASTKPGDHVLLRAEMDCIVVASACPQDLNEISNFTPTPVALELL